jgi:hypothetical protein
MYANRSSHQPEVMRSEVRTEAGKESLLATVVREAAAYEWLIAFYLCWLVFLALCSSGPYRDWCITWTTTSLAIHLSTVFAVRGGLITNSFVRGFATRIVSYGAFQYSYFGLRYLLPAAVPWSFDERLYQIDLRFFHYEPSLAWDRFVNSTTTEWFAFWYFLYFLIVAGHVFPILFGARDDKFLSEFAMGILTLFCVGHALYFVVPAYGPFKHLASHYQHALPSGYFMDLVNRTVAAGGAQKDVFPSHHTAAPLFMALFSYRYRHRKPFKYTWPFLAFASFNIIIATMFLRWHYMIDIFAGIALACFALYIGVRLARFDRERRARRGVGPVWPEMYSRESRQSSVVSHESAS